MSEENKITVSKGERFFLKIKQEMIPYEITHGELELDYIRNTQLKSKRLLVKQLAWSLIDIQTKKDTRFGYYKPVDCENPHLKLIIPKNIEFEIGPLTDKSVYIKVFS